jgi:hypothetical protein
MPSHHVRAVHLCATALLAAVVLTACASSRLSSEPPPGVRLAGDWKLDPTHSDDLGRAVDQLRAQERKGKRGSGVGRVQGASGSSESAASGHRHVRRGGAGGQQGGEADQSEAGSEPGMGADDIAAGPQRFSAVDELMSSVPQGDYLRIQVSVNAFTVTSGESSDQYTPGLVSEISAEQGDAQQISGWKGEEYVIDTKPQWGPEIIQSYGLTKDGKLTMTVRLSGGRTRLTFSRTYDRTTRMAPLAPPTIN